MADRTGGRKMKKQPTAPTLTLEVGKHEKGIPKDPYNCLFKCALQRALGKDFGGAEVLLTITTVVIKHVPYRYATPAKLRRAIEMYDMTQGGIWVLKPGPLTLHPLPQRKKKVGVKVTKTGGKKPYPAARSAPSRRIPSRRAAVA
jgi:hypothetical protein